MDEPLRFLSEDLQEKASLMIKELSKKLKLQFIIITHEPTLATYADKEFRVTIKNGISNVKEL
jgi:DNA repair exonuclease SbcCD ATPase subunit